MRSLLYPVNRIPADSIECVDCHRALPVLTGDDSRTGRRERVSSLNRRLTGGRDC